MKNKTKLKKLGALPVKQQPRYAKGTLIVNVRTSARHRAFAQNMINQQGSNYMKEGFSAIGRSYHVKPALFRQ